MPTTEIQFLLNGVPRSVRDADPCATVLDYLRGTEQLTGTKEGCAEGDCGACTVLLADESGKARAVNSCILFLPSLHGKSLVTVESLRGADGGLHPVQQAMVDHHASQCGFCTPGFVMSLLAMHLDGVPADRATVNDGLAGNLCRCTGYRPIADAALAVLQAAPAEAPPVAAPATPELALPPRYWAPRELSELATLYEAHPDAVLLAGGTDIGLWVTKEHRALSKLIALENVAALRAVEIGTDGLRIGAACCYSDLLHALPPEWDVLRHLLRRIGGQQVRNRGTVGGNIANASPVGDMPPALLAMDARLILRRGTVTREIGLDAFFLAYKKTALQPGEFIEAIVVPPPNDTFVRFYKLSKRFDQDVSSVMAAFAMRRGDDGIADVRVAFGGMAGIPSRARATEAALRNGDLKAALAALEQDFSPLDDWRGSAAYRQVVARNALRKFWLEARGETVAALA